MNKVDGGTPNHSTNLCASCDSYSTVEFANGKTRHNCAQFGRLTSPAVRCPSYTDKKVPPAYVYNSLAWVYGKDPATGHVTFYDRHAIRKMNARDGGGFQAAGEDDSVH